MNPLLHPKDLEKFIVDNDKKMIFLEFESTKENLDFSEDLEETFFYGDDNNKFTLISGIGIFIIGLERNEENVNRINYMTKKHKIQKIKILNQDKNILRIKVSQKPRNPIPRSLRHEVFKRDKYKCKECGATKEETSLEIDHILPVSRGGTDELDNLQTLCKECNRAKEHRILG